MRHAIITLIENGNPQILDNSKEFELKFDSEKYPFGVMVMMDNRFHELVSIQRNATEFHWKYPRNLSRNRFAVESDIHSEGGTYICNDYTSITLIPETVRAEKN